MHVEIVEDDNYFSNIVSIEFPNTYASCLIDDMKSGRDEGLLTADGNINKTWLW